MSASWSRPRGQIIPLFSIGCVALLGAIALGVDVAVMYFNWEGMQKAVDAAALAGANLLPEQPNAAQATATTIALSNGLLATEVNAVVSADDETITVSASRNVPYFFGRALGLSLIAPDNPAPGVTGLLAPDGIDTGKVVKYMRDRLGVSVQGGQDQMKGKLLRIGHMGNLAPFDMLVAVSALEMGLKYVGMEVRMGAGVAAVQALLARNI